MRGVEFDDEFDRKADEVKYVAPDRGLSAELVATEVLCAEIVPEAFFGWCGFVAEGAGEVALGFVAVHGAYLPPP